MDEQLQALTQRVQHLEDLEAIRHTWRDYCTRLDSEDWEGLGDVFAEDGVLEMVGLESFAPGLDGSYKGREAILRDFYQPVISGIEDPVQGRFATGHLSTNMQIDLEGDHASTLAYFFEIVGNDQILIGTYQHQMRREAERWRFARLRISVRYRAKLQGDDFGGEKLRTILERPV